MTHLAEELRAAIEAVKAYEACPLRDQNEPRLKEEAEERTYELIFDHGPAFLSLVEASEWREIADGSEVPDVPVLIWVPGAHRGIDSAEVAVACCGDDGLSWWTNGGPNGGSDYYFEHAPTNWRPLPAPPEGSKT